MRTDKLFYQIFLSQSALISELLPDIPANCEFEYSAPVVKEIELRLDGLLTPISEDLELPLVFIEAQMQSDADFYGRFFAGIFLYLRQYKIARPWRGLLILRRRSQDLGYNSPYQILLDAWVQRLYLEDLIPLTDLSPNLALLRLLVIPDREASGAAQSILSSSETELEFRRLLELVEAILINKFPRLSIEEVRQMLDLKEADSSQTRYYQEVLQIGKQEGRQEGRQEGWQEGRQEMLRQETALILRLLTRRCGNLMIAKQEEVRSLPIDVLESLGEALLDFRGVEDLEVWLRENVSG
jgi:predicted transposase/invertase (TIGR01784 family)